MQNISKYTRPRYVASSQSVTTFVGLLLTPVLSRNSNVLTLSNVDSQASFWELYETIDNGLTWRIKASKPVSEGLTYTLYPADMANATYNYRVRVAAQFSVPDDVLPGQPQTYHDEEFFSAYSSQNVTFTVSQLTAPVVASVNNDSRYYFTKDAAADYLEVRIENISEVVSVTQYTTTYPTALDPIELDYNAAGEYKIFAYNISNGWKSNSLYTKSSVVSNTMVYSVIKLQTPEVDDSRFVADPPTIFWDAIANASGYDVYLNGTKVESNYPTTSIDLEDYIDPTVFDYSVYVVANKYNQVAFANPKYIISGNSNSTVFGILATPALSINDNIITITNFSEFANADYFQIFNNGELWYNTPATNNTFKLESSVPKIFNIQVKAVSDSDHMTDSQLSSPVISYRILQIQTPSITGGYSQGAYSLSWNTVQNAEYYDVYLNSEYVGQSQGTSYSLALNAGYNTLYIVAKNHLYQYLDSQPSNILTYNKESDSQYYVIIEGQKYDIDLPLSGIETLDDTMDSGTLTVAPIARRDPFEAYTDIEVYACFERQLFDGDEVVGVEYVPQKSYPKHMLISQDDVEEIQYFADNINAPKYKHHINLIERTKLLENELVSDFSITQPMSFTQSVVDAIEASKGSVVEADYGGLTPINKYVSDDLDAFCGQNSGYNVTLAFYGRTLILPGWWAEAVSKVNFNVNTDFDKTPIYRNYQIGEHINLPKNYAQGFNFVSFTRRDTSLEGAISIVLDTVNTLTGTRLQNSVKDLGITFTKTYKYRRHSNRYENDPACPETIINTVHGNSDPGAFDTSGLQSGEYDIIFEMDISDADWNKAIEHFKQNSGGIGGLMYSDDHLCTTKPQLMLTQEAIDSYHEYHSKHGYPIVFGGIGYKPEYTTEFIDKCRKFRVVWSGIGLSTGRTLSPTEHISETAVSLLDGMNKAITALKPIEGNSTPKYTIDSEFNYLGNKVLAKDSDGNAVTDVFGNAVYSPDYPCPEFKFQNQKSLYEVLSEIGREIYGIPRLGCYQSENGVQVWKDNCITFDLLNPELVNAALTSDTESLETTQSSIDNHATGYVSNISNMIADSSKIPAYHTYPSGDVWINPRSSSDADPLANKDNMSIVLDKPIYRIVDVLVTNFDPSSPDSIVSIKDYVYEQTIFNSLNNNADGKGLAIYYKKGDNKILGLGTIPQQSMWHKILNISESDYIISRILRDAGAAPIMQVLNNRVNQFKYKIVYVPYTDTKVYTEQANIANLRKSTYKNMNQENNIVSDSMFGKSAQTQIERLGNNTITKDFLVSSYDDLPKLGQIKEFNGQKYYADRISYSINNNYVSANVEFSKNFNKINERVGINSDYRQFRIYNSEVIERDVHVNKYCYISTDKYNISTNTIPQKLVDHIKRAFNNGSNVSLPYAYPDTAYIRMLKSDGSRLQYNDWNGQLQNVPSMVIPLAMNKFNNSVQFSGEFLDNFSAGIKASSVAEIPGIDLGLFTEVEKTQRIQQDVRYVDTNGNADILGLTLFNIGNNTDRLITANNTTGSNSWPEATYVEDPGSLNDVIYSQRIKLDKDNREKIRLSYQLHFQTYDKQLFIHRGIVDRLFDNNSSTVSIGGRQSPAYYFVSEDVSKSEYIVNQDTQNIGIPAFTSDSQSISIAAVTATADKDYNGYALVWPDGSIVFSYSQPISAGESITIPKLYMNFADNKIEYREK